MKNVVVEIQGKYAVLMSNEGDFIRVKNKKYEVGQLVEKETKSEQKAGLARWAFTAAAALLILFSGGTYAYYTPYTDTSFDINPSIELSTNIFDIVIDVKAMNGDAEQLLQKIQLKDCDMQTAMTRLVDELVSEGYLTPEQVAEIMVTTSSEDQTRAKIILQEMTKALKKEMDQKRVQANIQGECIGEDLKIRARELGVSPGKLMLAEQYALSTGDPSSVNIEDWLKKSVRDIVAAINQQQNNGSVPANSSQKQNGYNGGDLKQNGYNGGDQSSNGQNAGETDQNGYTGGDKSDNGYNGGTDINNDENSDTTDADDNKNCKQKKIDDSQNNQNSNSGTDTGSQSTGGNTDAGNTSDSSGNQGNSVNPTDGNNSGNQSGQNSGITGGRS